MRTHPPPCGFERKGIDETWTHTAAVALTAVLTPGVVAASDHDPIQPLTDIPPIDGSNHNLSDPSANQAGTAEKRFLPDTYLDHLGGDSSQFPGRTGLASATSRTTCSPRTRTRS